MIQLSSFYQTIFSIINILKLGNSCACTRWCCSVVPPSPQWMWFGSISFKRPNKHNLNEFIQLWYWYINNNAFWFVFSYDWIKKKATSFESWVIAVIAKPLTFQYASVQLVIYLNQTADWFFFFKCIFRMFFVFIAIKTLYFMAFSIEMRSKRTFFRQVTSKLWLFKMCVLGMNLCCANRFNYVQCK